MPTCAFSCAMKYDIASGSDKRWWLSCTSVQQSQTTDRDRDFSHFNHTSFDVNHVCFSSTGRSRRRCRLLFRCFLVAAAPGFCEFLFACFALRWFRFAGSKSLGLTTYAAVLQTVRAGSEAQQRALPAVYCCLLTDRRTN